MFYQRYLNEKKIADDPKSQNTEIKFLRSPNQHILLYEQVLD